MRSIYSICVVLSFISCTVNQPTSASIVPVETITPIPDNNEIDNTEKKHNVAVSILKYIPYCGGAAPSPDQLNRNHPYTGPLLVINQITGEKSEMWVNGGSHYTLLSPGKYYIKEKFKDVKLEDFINTHKRDGMYYLDSSDDCYENWMNQNLFEFEIINEDTVVNLNTSIGSSCFTGNNPCLQYTGPYPP